MGALGTKVVITSQDDFERLIVMATVVKGEFDPEREYGEVYFANPGAAIIAWRTL